MASMISNVLGYLCPKGQENATPRRGCSEPDKDGENEDFALVYGIEDVQDDWQIVRKMSDAANEQEDCLDDGSGEALFALEEDAASSSLRATLYRSAPPLIMEENLNGHRSPSPGPTVSAETTAEPSSHRVIHAKRKRRVRAQRHAQVATTATPATPATTPRELGVCCAADEHDKQSQNEEKDFWTGKKLLAKNQLQRGNLLPEAAGPKKRANREGNYRCLH